MSLPASKTFASLSTGQKVLGLVQEVCDDHLWLGLSPVVRGRVHLLEAAEDPSVLAAFADKFKVGQGLAARITNVNAKKTQLDLSLRGLTKGSQVGASGDVQAGALVMGRVAGVSGAGVRVQLAGKAGRVAVTDVHDAWVANALEGIKEGVFVRARVLSMEDGRPVLSLRPSQGGKVAGGWGRHLGTCCRGVVGLG